jgi:hypothetical protein
VNENAIVFLLAKNSSYTYQCSRRRNRTIGGQVEERSPIYSKELPFGLSCLSWQFIKLDIRRARKRVIKLLAG